jgi:hypothetical protein
MEERPMSSAPMQELQVRAEHERERLHDSLFELRDRVRETVNPNRVVHSHLAVVCLVAGLTGLAVGYLLSGPFLRK